MNTYIHRLDLASLLETEQCQHQASQPLFTCQPLNIKALDITVLVLKQGDVVSIPSGDRDQFYILLAGSANVSFANTDGLLQQPQCITELGTTLYQPPHSQLQLVGHGVEAAIFLQAQLLGKQNRSGAIDPAPTIKSPSNVEIASVRAGEERGIIVDASTPSLRRLHSFFLMLKAGSIVHQHQHRDHGVLLVVLEGSIEIKGEVFAAPTILYYRGGEPHGFSCVDDSGVKAIAIEFYQEPPIVERLRSGLRDSPVGAVLRQAKTKLTQV